MKLYIIKMADLNRGLLITKAGEAFYSRPLDGIRLIHVGNINFNSLKELKLQRVS